MGAKEKMKCLYVLIWMIWYMLCDLFFFFFFQAEDGIRDVRTWLEFRRVLFRSLGTNHLVSTTYMYLHVYSSCSSAGTLREMEGGSIILTILSPIYQTRDIASTSVKFWWALDWHRNLKDTKAILNFLSPAWLIWPDKLAATCCNLLTDKTLRKRLQSIEWCWITSPSSAPIVVLGEGHSWIICRVM